MHLNNATAAGSYGYEDNNYEHNDTFDIKQPSDIFMMAMIIAMMFCMTFCCLCLFCRRSAEFSICGINFELNNEPEDAILDDLNELHEVMPLTPTEGGPQYPVLDIESRLKSDSPPPRYSEVDNSAFKWIFKGSTKKRSASSSNSTKNRRSSLLGGFSRPRISFRRSRSLNQYQNNTNNKMISDSAFPALSEEKLTFRESTAHQPAMPPCKEDSCEDTLLNMQFPMETSKTESTHCSPQRNYENDDVFE